MRGLVICTAYTIRPRVILLCLLRKVDAAINIARPGIQVSLSEHEDVR